MHPTQTRRKQVRRGRQGRTQEGGVQAGCICNARQLRHERHGQVLSVARTLVIIGSAALYLEERGEITRARFHHECIGGSDLLWPWIGAELALAQSGKDFAFAPNIPTAYEAPDDKRRAEPTRATAIPIES